jgi:hypothetical protein
MRLAALVRQMGSERAVGIIGGITYVVIANYVYLHILHVIFYLLKYSPSKTYKYIGISKIIKMRMRRFRDDRNTRAGYRS